MATASQEFRSLGMSYSRPNAATVLLNEDVAGVNCNGKKNYYAYAHDSNVHGIQYLEVYHYQHTHERLFIRLTSATEAADKQVEPAQATDLTQ